MDAIRKFLGPLAHYSLMTVLIVLITLAKFIFDFGGINNWTLLIATCMGITIGFLVIVLERRRGWCQIKNNLQVKISHISDYVVSLILLLGVFGTKQQENFFLILACSFLIMLTSNLTLLKYKYQKSVEWA
jgi:hypothetical protein